MDLLQQAAGDQGQDAMKGAQEAKKGSQEAKKGAQEAKKGAQETKKGDGRQDVIKKAKSCLSTMEGKHGKSPVHVCCGASHMILLKKVLLSALIQLNLHISLLQCRLLCVY